MADAPQHPRVLGVLAGADMAPSALKAWVDSSDIILAADGGADRLHEIGVIPDATIGDLDSITEETAAEQRTLIRDNDQDTTDCDKLLSLAGSRGFTQITLAGVEGDLVDHIVGTLLSAAKSPLAVRLALRRGLGFVLRGPQEWTFEATVGKRLSVLPLTTCEGVTLVGAKWELTNASLDPIGLTSLSNVTAESCVQLSLRVGHVFVFVETHGDQDWTSL